MINIHWIFSFGEKQKSVYKDKNHLTMKYKSELINYIGKKLGYSSYLEISTSTTGHQFKQVDNNIFTYKDCIHYLPDTTNNEFLTEKVLQHGSNGKEQEPASFETHVQRLHGKKFDLVFVDPFHTVKDTKRDLNTALEFLAENGIIIVHDCLPKTEYLVGPPRMGPWCGQTFEAFLKFRAKHPEWLSGIVDIDCGCGIIYPSKKASPAQQKALKKIDLGSLSNWHYFNSLPRLSKNILPVEKFLKSRFLARPSLTKQPSPAKQTPRKAKTKKVACPTSSACFSVARSSRTTSYRK